MPTDTRLISDDLSFAKAFEILEQSNLTQVEINSLVWGLLGEALGKSKRVFNYTKTFEPSAPACEVGFARSFVHTDWIDGESVVQAEHNSIEEGFNSRFHKIEDDLDALSTDSAKALRCIGDMRAELAALLTEIRTEINRINADVHECCHKTAGGGGPWTFDPFFPGPLQPYPWPPGGGGIGPIGPIGPIWTDPRAGGPLGPWVYDVPWRTGTGPPFGGVGTTPWTTPATLETILKHIGSTAYPGPAVIRSASDPTRATVAGMPARRLDVKVFNGQPFEVWSTSGGIVMTPAPEGVRLEDQAERAWENPRAKAAGDIAAWAADKGDQLAEVFGDGTTVGAVTAAFGDDRLDGGTTLRDALTALPSSTRLDTPADLLQLVSEQAALGIARDGMTAETLVATIGFNAELKEVAEVPIADFKAMPVAARTAMAEAGIRTVGELAKADPERLAEQLTAAGLRTGVADAGRWTGEAMVMDKLAAPIRR
jgi:hypothetical protein